MAGTHLPTLEGWKAELTRVSGYVVRQFTCPKAVTHPSTHRAQCNIVLFKGGVQPKCGVQTTKYVVKNWKMRSPAVGKLKVLHVK